MQELVLYEEDGIQVQVQIAESLKRYCKYGLSIVAPAGKMSHQPNIFTPTGYFSKEVALINAQAEAVAWLSREAVKAPPAQRAIFQKAIEALQEPLVDDLDLY